MEEDTREMVFLFQHLSIALHRGGMQSPSWLHSTPCDTRSWLLFLPSLIFTPAALCWWAKKIKFIILKKTITQRAEKPNRSSSRRRCSACWASKAFLCRSARISCALSHSKIELPDLVKWVPALAGNAKAGMVHSISRCMQGSAE